MKEHASSPAKMPSKTSKDMSEVSIEVYLDMVAWLKRRGKTLPSKLSEQQTKDFSECFALMDDDASGSIDVAELENAFKLLGIDATRKEVETIMAEVDGDGSGQVEFNEFIKIMTEVLQKVSTEAEETGNTSGTQVPFALMSTAYKRKRYLTGITAGNREVLKQIQLMEERKARDTFLADKEKEAAALMVDPSYRSKAHFAYHGYKAKHTNQRAQLGANMLSFLSPQELAMVGGVLSKGEKLEMHGIEKQPPGSRVSKQHFGGPLSAPFQAAGADSPRTSRRVVQTSGPTDRRQVVSSSSMVYPQGRVPASASTACLESQVILSWDPINCTTRRSITTPLPISIVQDHKGMLRPPSSNLDLRFSRPIVTLPPALRSTHVKRGIQPTNATGNPSESNHTGETPPYGHFEGADPSLEYEVQGQGIYASHPADVGASLGQADVQGLGRGRPQWPASGQDYEANPRTRAHAYAERLRSETTDMFITAPGAVEHAGRPVSRSAQWPAPSTGSLTSLPLTSSRSERHTPLNSARGERQSHVSSYKSERLPMAPPFAPSLSVGNLQGSAVAAVEDESERHVMNNMFRLVSMVSPRNTGMYLPHMEGAKISGAVYPPAQFSASHQRLLPRVVTDFRAADTFNLGQRRSEPYPGPAPHHVSGSHPIAAAHRMPSHDGHQRQGTSADSLAVEAHRIDAQEQSPPAHERSHPAHEQSDPAHERSHPALLGSPLPSTSVSASPLPSASEEDQESLQRSSPVLHGLTTADDYDVTASTDGDKEDGDAVQADEAACTDAGSGVDGGEGGGGVGDGNNVEAQSNGADCVAEDDVSTADSDRDEDADGDGEMRQEAANNAVNLTIPASSEVDDVYVVPHE